MSDDFSPLLSSLYFVGVPVVENLDLQPRVVRMVKNEYGILIEIQHGSGWTAQTIFKEVLGAARRKNFRMN